MMFRTLAFVLVTSSLVAVAAGCSADATPDSSSETGTAKGRGSSRGSDESGTEPGDDDRGGTRRPGGGGWDDDGDSKGGGGDSQVPSKKGNGAQCSESADCESDFCVFQGGRLGMCTTTCDGNIDCDLGWTCVKLSDAPQKVCAPE